MSGVAGARSSPWGFWASVGFTVAVVVSQFIAQTFFAGFYLVLFGDGADAAELFQAAGGLSSDGLFLGMAMLATAPVAIGLTGLFAWLKRGPRLLDYFAIRSAPPLLVLRWLVYTLVLMFLLAVASYTFGFEQSLDWMVSLYRETSYVAVLVVALVVAAPLVEEILFRGFFYEGLTQSRVGPAGAIVLSSLAWSCLHIQYNLFFIGQVFLLGILFGLARHQTGSLIVPISMHALNNGIAVAMLAAEASA